jgi:hypothetical protein
MPGVRASVENWQQAQKAGLALTCKPLVHRSEISPKEQTGVLGFEPRQTDPESVVLPLHYTPNSPSFRAAAILGVRIIRQIVVAMINVAMVRESAKSNWRLMQNGAAGSIWPRVFRQPFFQTLQAFIDADSRLVAQIAAGGGQVEPMRGGKLLRQEAGHSRFAPNAERAINQF